MKQYLALIFPVTRQQKQTKLSSGKEIGSSLQVEGKPDSLSVEVKGLQVRGLYGHHNKILSQSNQSKKEKKYWFI